MIINFDPAKFRLLYPRFASLINFPDVTLENYWQMSGNYFGGYENNCDNTKEMQLYLLTAHFAALFVDINANKKTGVVQGSNVDGVSISLVPPDTKDQFKWWLNLTPYGAQLLAFLKLQSIGGNYFGGSPENSAFRSLGGYFGF